MTRAASRVALPALFLTLLSLAHAFRAEPDEHPSEASRVLATYAPPTPAAFSAAAAARAAEALLESLDGGLRARCALAIDSPERANWTNVPPRADERGLRLGDMSEPQLQRTCDLLAACLSTTGYAKARDIALADDRLLRNGAPRTGFGAENFWLVLFGEPGPESTWGLQLDGHHLALNLSFVGERMTMSPSFLGAQPSSFDRDGERVVPLRAQVDAAFTLMASLDDDQRAAALVGPKRTQLVAGPGRDGVVPEPMGLLCDTLDDAQHAHLVTLLRSYVSDQPVLVSTPRMKALESELDQMHFAWWGPTEDPSDVSYRIQGPSILIEYACQDLGGNPLDHLHSIYRDPTNEYGAGF